MDDGWKTFLLYVGGWFAIVLLVVAAHVVRSHWEAEAYARLTGKPVTTWDAMFLDLRVQESVQD